MSWPTKIQLFNSEYSHSYNGAEVRETWLIEPYDAYTAFQAAMLGRVDIGDDGKTPDRTLPAQHFLYKSCLAVKCDMVPENPESFSYMGSAKLTQPVDNQAAIDDQLSRITNAVSTYSGPFGPLGPRTDIDTQIMSRTNSTYSAGCFVAVTYLRVITAAQSQDSATDSSMDLLNWRFEPQERTNVVNASLRLITPLSVINLKGGWYPAAGVAPVFKEEYQRFIAERKMLSPTFDLSKLAGYKNLVNANAESLSGIQGVSSRTTFPAETLRFEKFTTEYVQVDTVDADGEPDGYTRWLNLTLEWDWRTTLAKNVYDSAGNTDINGDTVYSVGWNHILAYPGTLTWLVSTAGLAWYHARYSSGAPGRANVDAYPHVQDIVNPAATILDPLTINP